MSKTVARLIAGFGRTVSAPLNRVRRTSCRATAAQYLIDKIPVQTPHGELTMYCNSRETAMYPPVYMTHEPDTLKWIDGMPVDTVFWDIGANVGIYTMYAGLARHRTLAFEPASSTYFTLMKNLEINGLLDRVDAYCLAFDNQTRLGKLNMAGNISGSSMHAFERDSHSWDEQIDIKIAHPTLGFNIDTFISLYDPPLPTHIKLDVDSTEKEILEGAANLLAKGQVQSIWVEVDGALERERNQGIIKALDAMGYAANHTDGRTRNLEFLPKAN